MAPLGSTRIAGAAIAALAGAALLAALPAPAEAASKQRRECRGADLTVHDMSGARARRVTLCLLNNERRARGRRVLRHNRRLARAARRHARDMVRNDYFAHDSQDGTDFVERILDARYVTEEDRSWSVGENLAWGSGDLGTPRAIVRAWMRSRGHRANILRRRYREIGISVIRGAPVEDVTGAGTYVTEFGVRRRR